MPVDAFKAPGSSSALGGDESRGVGQAEGNSRTARISGVVAPVLRWILSKSSRSGRTPNPTQTTSFASPVFLEKGCFAIFEYLDMGGRSSAERSELMGAQLARMHKSLSPNGKYGFHVDNTIGGMYNALSARYFSRASIEIYTILFYGNVPSFVGVD